jgi:hypothetical protein
MQKAWAKQNEAIMKATEMDPTAFIDPGNPVPTALTAAEAAAEAGAGPEALTQTPEHMPLPDEAAGSAKAKAAPRARAAPKAKPAAKAQPARKRAPRKAKTAADGAKDGDMKPASGAAATGKTEPR